MLSIVYYVVWLLLILRLIVTDAQKFKEKFEAGKVIMNKLNCKGATGGRFLLCSIYRVYTKLFMDCHQCKICLFLLNKTNCYLKQIFV